MEKLNVLFIYKSDDKLPYHILPDECITQIKNIGNKIELSVVDIAPEDKPDDSPEKNNLNNVLKNADIIIGDRLPHNLVKRAPNLKWFQSMLVGVDRLLNDPNNKEFRNSKIKMTNVRGIGSLPIAECVVAMMLMLVKKMPLNFEQQQLKQWKPVKTELLYDKTVGIVGLGSIGSEVARLCRIFGVRIIATNEPAKPSRLADTVYPPEKLPKLLSESDFVILTVPLTDKTFKLIGEKQLRIMKPAAYLINVSRGNVTDEEALIKALKEKWIAGAGLDVFASEPLPSSSKFWGIPNVIVTPHIASYVDNYDKIAVDMFCENLKRYLKGDRLKNIINKKKGY